MYFLPIILRRLVAGLVLFAAGSRVGATSAPLNIVFILADDLGYGDLGSYGQEKIPTPHLDRLAAEGMRFTQHYSGAPTCAPSRCVLLTGRHLGRAEIRGNEDARRRFPEYGDREGQYPLSADAVTVAQAFRRAGYATAAIGKWGLGPSGSTGDPNRQGFDHFFGYLCQRVAHSFYPPHLWRNADRIIINEKPVPGHARQPGGEVRMEDWIGKSYAPDLLVAEAEHFIAAHARQPFFLYLPFIEPHVAMHPPRASVDRFPADWDTDAYRGENLFLPHPRPRAAYAAMVSDLDGHVGRVMAALERAGIADRTLVVFTSDNGPSMKRIGDTTNSRFHVGGVDVPFFNSTGGLRGHKGSVYEGGLRVPTIARLPGRIPAGLVSDGPGYFADWFPTLAEAAGLQPEAATDGESLWPAMTGVRRITFERRPMIWVFAEYGGQVAVRLGDFKLVRRNLHAAVPGAWEVFDLARDRAESRDLAGENPALIEEAEAILRREVADNAAFPVPLHLAIVASDAAR